MAKTPTLTGVAVLAALLVAGGFVAKQLKARHDLDKAHAVAGAVAGRPR